MRAGLVSRLGNGTSLMIFANIVSALPGSIGTALKQSQEAGNTSALAVFFAAFAAVALGIVYVQEAERKIPIVYASKFRAGGLSQRAYLPFKVVSVLHGRMLGGGDLLFHSGRGGGTPPPWTPSPPPPSAQASPWGGGIEDRNLPQFTAIFQ